MDDRQDIGPALAVAARGMNRRASLEETLASIVDVARGSLPGFDEVGISLLDRKGNVETKAATGQLVWTLDKLQYELSEGPCVDSLHGETIVEAPHVRHDQRWPRYVPRAVEEGLKAQLAVRLYLDDQGTVGGLNIYSTTSEDIDPEAVQLADLFAAHAAIALGHARERDNLNEALHSRKIIGEAIGLVMGRYQLTEDRAFAFLVRTSSHANIKLRDIAQAMVDEANHAHRCG
jgi:GAF domain-containing protein